VGSRRNQDWIGASAALPFKSFEKHLLPAAVTKQADFLEVASCMVWHLHCNAGVELIQEFPALSISIDNFY